MRWVNDETCSIDHEVLPKYEPHLTTKILYYKEDGQEVKSGSQSWYMHASPCNEQKTTHKSLIL